ncbi:MAG: imidazolonepropionase [Steroidobacteraceae bacterium]
MTSTQPITPPQASPRERIWRNASLATMAARGPAVVHDAAVVVRGEHIAYAGPASAAPQPLDGSTEVIDCGGRWITPGLVDCHTHLVHGGNRANEFEMRLNGSTYQQIAAAGGGIISTLRATRAASQAQLVAEALPRLDAMLAGGVTTVEIKSGYGLDLDNERKMLAAARELAALRAVRVRTTIHGAHALPPDAQGDADAYIALVTEQMLPQLSSAGLVDAVDAFCEGIAFSPAQVAHVFDAATRLGLPVKLHADQLSNLQGAKLAAGYRALSADHLEHTDETGVIALARAGTVAVILPGAFYFLREKQLPPLDLLRRHGVPMAIATDMNPGTSPLTSLLLAMNMAATQFRMTVDECLAGVTREAARALGVADTTGTVEVGKYADLAIWNIGSPAELVYRIGFNPLHSRIWRGR